ncbi:molecular chaperone DnaK [Candidatus Riesia sp. GBBU]|nr:molecular chaperone DnaK [Candidatus Riesia sp. GBBU]
MNESNLNYFRNLLEKHRDHLIKKIGKSTIQMQNRSVNFPDPIDRAVQEESFNLELKNRNRDHKLIQKIEKTLKKFKEKNFGYCENCGIEIGIQRLKARPTADLCIDCKTVEEIKERQKIG